MNYLDNPIYKDIDYKKKILLFDIETAPNIGAYFELYREGNIIWNEEHWYMLSFSWKWLGEKQTHVLGLPDFKSWKKHFCNKCKRIENTNDIDKELVIKLHDLFNQAEIIIAHNGDQFDIKKANARFIKHHLTPPTNYKTIDTKKLAKKSFKFDSNKLDDLGDYFLIGRKLETEKGLWRKCMSGDLIAWKKMLDYNKQDVILLEKVYYRLRGWSETTPNLNLIYGGIYSCPECASSNVIKNGYKRSRVAIYQCYKCNNCGRNSQGEILERNKPLK